MDTDELVELVVGRVADCYEQHDLCCSESVMVVFNRAFDGGLSDQVALQMGAGFCHGLGGAGCSCGALTGSVSVLSLFLGPHLKTGLTKKNFKRIIKGVHDDFRQQFGSSCCRVLSKKVKHDAKAHQNNCLMLTKGAATLAVSALLDCCPELQHVVDLQFLTSRLPPVGNQLSSSSSSA